MKSKIVMPGVHREPTRVFLAVWAIVAIATFPFSAEAARAVVTEAGADPTGRTDSTPAIQKCIDRVSAAGGGTVVVPFQKDDFNHAYEALQLNDDHSYGFSGYTGRRVYDTWAQHIDWIETAERASETASTRPNNPVKNGVAENQWYRIAVTNGVIYSIFDKERSTSSPTCWNAAEPPCRTGSSRWHRSPLRQSASNARG